MKIKRKEDEKYCGNCSYHNIYEYPSRVFCTYRLVKGLNPVVSTLWCCDNWTAATDECFCVENAKKHIERRTKPT